MLAIVKVENNRVSKYADFASQALADVHVSKYGGFVYDGTYSRDLWVVGQTVTIVPVSPTAQELQAVEDEAAVTVVKANAVINYLVTHTPAECAAKVQTDVTNLATAKDMLAHFAQALCVLAKDRLR